jgi:hypothetical protein
VLGLASVARLTFKIGGMPMADWESPLGNQQGETLNKNPRALRRDAEA